MELDQKTNTSLTTKISIFSKTFFLFAFYYHFLIRKCILSDQIFLKYNQCFMRRHNKIFVLVT